MRYLMIVPVPFRPVDGGAAVESAFATHLRELLASLAPRVTSIEVLAPALPPDPQATAASALAILRPDVDRIAFTADPACGTSKAHSSPKVPPTDCNRTSSVRLSPDDANKSIFLSPFRSAACSTPASLSESAYTCGSGHTPFAPCTHTSTCT